MTIIHKTKRGFTLLEMMLAIAIVTIISGCLVSLIVAIKDSYLSTYNSDDSADYAMLFAQGFENSFLAATQNRSSIPSKASYTWSIKKKADANGIMFDTLYKDSTPVFSLSQMTVRRSGESSNVAKWLIKMEYSWNSTNGMVNYTIYVIDNYYNPGHMKCVYNGGFLMPHFNGTDYEISTTAANADHDGSTITFKKKT